MRKRNIGAATVILCLVAAIQVEGQPQSRLTVLDSVGTEVGAYVGITQFRNSLRVAVMRFVPSTDKWVIFPLGPDGFGLNNNTGDQIRYASTDCSGTGFMRMGPTGDFGLVQITPQLWGGAALHYYYAYEGPTSFTELSRRFFDEFGVLGPCSEPSVPIAIVDGFEVHQIDFAGLFVPPFVVEDSPIP